MVLNFFDKKSSVNVIKKENILNKELAGELSKTINQKTWQKESALTIYRQYLGCGSCRYSSNKQMKFINTWLQYQKMCILINFVW